MSYLVPDVLLGELALSDKPEVGAAHFARWLLYNRDRMFIGVNWNHIAEAERALDRPAVATDVIDVRATDDLVRALDDNGFEAWRYGLRVTATGHAATSNEAKRAQFVRQCESFREFLGPQAMDWKKKYATVDQRRDWIQQPQLAFEGAATFFPQYCPADWEERIACFPDVYAVGRTSRIFAWSALLSAAGLTKGLANNWDDSQYAFLATYAGRLRTRDSRLAEMVRAISPTAVVE